MKNNLPTNVVVGSIFRCSWGYDQTNVDFYQVVKLNKATVSVRPIAKHVVEDGMMCGKATAVKDSFTGEPMVKRIRVSPQSTSFRVTSFSNAYLMANPSEPQYVSWYH
jgi:hypothetical protein